MNHQALKIESDFEYALQDGENSVWITVGEFSVYIRRTNDGIITDIYKKGNESNTALASTYALNSELGD